MRHRSTSRAAGLRGPAALVLALALGGCVTAGQPSGPNAQPVTAAGTESAGRAPKFLRLAQQSLDAGNHAAAAEFYRKAVNAAPDSFRARLGLAKAKYAQGKARDAVNAYRAALEIRPESGQAKLGLGQALLADDQLEHAIEAADTLLAAGGEGHRPYLVKGVALDLLGRHEAAQRTYRAGLEMSPENLSLKNNLGLSLAVSGAHGEAIRLLEDIADAPAAPARTRQNLALAYGLAGEMQDAAATARRDLAPESVERNLRYYRRLRTLRTQTASAEPGAAPRPTDELQPMLVSASAGSEDERKQPDRAQPAAKATAPGEAALLSKGAEAPAPATQSRAAEPTQPPAEGEPIQLSAAIAMPGRSDDAIKLSVRRDGGPSPTSEPGTGETEPEADLTALVTAASSALASDKRDAEGRTGPAYWVQFASMASKARGEQARAELTAAFPALASTLPLALHQADAGDKGVRHRLHSGPFTARAAPAELCAALRDRGQGCFVVRRNP